jgi:DNA topoisomerase-1
VVDSKKVPVIDVENGFKEVYEVPVSKAKVVAGLRAAAKDADELILATDPDREGEAISWHLLEAIKPPRGLPVRRGLSAGRVQSVTVRLIVDREREIQAFNPMDYWALKSILKKTFADFTRSLGQVEEAHSTSTVR